MKKILYIVLILIFIVIIYLRLFSFSYNLSDNLITLDLPVWYSDSSLKENGYSISDIHTNFHSMVKYDYFSLKLSDSLQISDSMEVRLLTNNQIEPQYGFIQIEVLPKVDSSLFKNWTLTPDTIFIEQIADPQKGFSNDHAWFNEIYTLNKDYEFGRHTLVLDGKKSKINYTIFNKKCNFENSFFLKIKTLIINYVYKVI
jgi:hypothetical protein